LFFHVMPCLWAMGYALFFRPWPCSLEGDGLLSF
jgi:hypothetical protein